MDIRRIVLIVLDSVGIGELPDASLYGDSGSNTLVNTARAAGGLDLPNLQKLGLGNIDRIPGVAPRPDCQGAFGKMMEKSPGKDTTTGHWELAGLILDRPFPTYPNGFPPEVLEPFQRAVGRGILGNRPASGTRIIAELGEEHMKTGKPIVYTSADSVFQIAAHEEVIPVPELYEMCRKARSILTAEHGVGRVIARPFIGTPGSFTRTANRRDFSLPPPEPTVLDRLVEAGERVYAVGKIEDIFAGRGITEAVHTENNADVMEKTMTFMDRVEAGLIFANCVDFDMLWGHRNNVKAYARGLEEFDQLLTGVLDRLKPEDLLLITADHGCDPTTESTDHSREYVPLLVYGERVQAGTDLGVRQTFADVGATVAEVFGVPAPRAGTSFAAQVL